MVSIPLEWTLSVKGGNEVKTVLNDLDSAFNRGQISVGEYNNSLSQLNRTSLQSINVGRYQNNIYLSQHPNLLKISRVLSTVTSITRGLLTLTNALNISKIQGNQVDEAASDHLSKASEAMREHNRLVAENGGETDESRLAMERYNTEMALYTQRVQDIKDSNFNEFFTMIQGNIIAGAAVWVAFTKSLGLLSSAFIKLASPIASVARGLVSIFANPALSQGLPFFASQLLGLIPGMKELRQSFADWLKSIGTLDVTWLDKGVSEFFNNTIPMAIGNAGLALTQFFLTDLPLWAGIGLKTLSDAFTATWGMISVGAVDFMNSVISTILSGINWLISKINSIISKLKKAGVPISTITPIIFEPIKYPNMIKAATGFDGMVNRPTMFLAGEAGPEQVSITPNGGGRSGGGNTLIINVGGSVVTERKLAQIVDQYQKQNLKSRGFTGFG